MIIPKKEEDSFSQTWHNALLDYHLEISNQLPNPPSCRFLTQMPTKELFSSLQLSIYMLNNLLLTTQQSHYEIQLRSYESKLRTQYRMRCLMKLKIEAMENKILSLLSKGEEPKTSKVINDLLTQKENEILILRAENSNLKATIVKLEANSNHMDNNDNHNKPRTLLNNNINININDITNSNVIIKTRERYPVPITPIKKIKRDYYLSSSQSNRNIFFVSCKGSVSPNKISKSNLSQSKMNNKDYEPNGKYNYISNTVKKKNKNTISNTKTPHKDTNRYIQHKSSMASLIVYSSYQNSQNNTLAKGTINSTPRAETVRDVPKYNSKKK